MPKVQRTDSQIRADTLTGIIKKYQSKRNISTPKLATRMRLSESGMYTKIREPERITAMELCQLVRILQIPAHEILEFLNIEQEEKPINVQVVIDRNLLSEILGKERV